VGNIHRWRGDAERLRLLGHPIRLALLNELLKAPKCVSDIQDLLHVRQANVSQHLAVLRQAKIVDYHEDGNLRCYYILCPDLVRDLLRFLGNAYASEPLRAEQVRRDARVQHDRFADRTTVALS